MVIILGLLDSMQSLTSLRQHESDKAPSRVSIAFHEVFAEEG